MFKFRSTKGEKGFMAWKIDLSKVYDRLSWNFIEVVLHEVGLPTSLIQLIMEYVSSVTYQVCVNEDLTSTFTPSNGTRQGDPLSPYLFVLCIDKLSHLIMEAVGKQIWKPIKAYQAGPAVSHLFFADDLILFAEASSHQARTMLRPFFKEVAANISCICGSPLTTNLGKYLRMPLLHSRVTKVTYSNLVDKKHKIHLCQWDLVCKPKSKGGLGLKKTHDINQALQAKGGWRLLRKDEGLLIWRLRKGDKYVPLMQIVDLAPDLNLNSLVSDFFVNGWWDVEKLKSVLPEEWAQKVTGCSANLQGVLEDCHIWKPTSNRLFSVKSAYSLLF
ncbi:hypothetical protein PRUPE_2G114200 [Prunus persica]|uniref:Reverse transcriptase domain-containing protein n=1 Tax=Prunus persica TaxID=3760 RepID=A0A251QEK0_PRUPE|nr:hypothetical protein PRUPE_2G114200 [Prunus persica]